MCNKVKLNKLDEYFKYKKKIDLYIIIYYIFYYYMSCLYEYCIYT